MLVKQFSHGWQPGGRQPRKNALRGLQLPWGSGLHAGRAGVGPICYGASRGAKAIFETDETLVLPIGDPQIKFRKPFRLCFLDGPPEQQLRAAEIAECSVGATVLVNQGAAILERQDAC